MSPFLLRKCFKNWKFQNAAEKYNWGKMSLYRADFFKIVSCPFLTYKLLMLLTALFSAWWTVLPPKLPSEGSNCFVWMNAIAVFCSGPHAWSGFHNCLFAICFESLPSLIRNQPLVPWSGIVPFDVGSRVPFCLEPWEVPLLKMIGSGKNFWMRDAKVLCCAVLFSLFKTHTLRCTHWTVLETHELESQPTSLLVGVLLTRKGPLVNSCIHRS